MICRFFSAASILILKFDNNILISVQTKKTFKRNV